MVNGSANPERITLRGRLNRRLNDGDTTRVLDVTQISASLLAWSGAIFNHEYRDLIMNTPFMSSDFAFNVTQIGLAMVGTVGLINGVLRFVNTSEAIREVESEISTNAFRIRRRGFFLRTVVHPPEHR